MHHGVAVVGLIRGLRARLGLTAARLLPGLEDRVFNRDRNRSVPDSRSPRQGYARRVFRERPIHVLVVPAEGPHFPDWRPGTRNFYYEAWQSGREKFGDDSVSFLDIAPGSSVTQWHSQLIDRVHDDEITHIVTHIEHDPSHPNRWTWDEAWNRLAPAWDGALLGVMFDSAFDLVSMKSRRLARMSDHFLAVDICMPFDGALIRGRSEVGPVTMPVSGQSLALVDQRLADVTQRYDVSFIGALYPYRVELIQRLRSQGFEVAVNPHRADTTRDFAQSRTNQPGWLDYMAGLAASRMTINFSRSSAGAFEQLKTRVIEATLAGTFLLTDDRNRTRLYFEPEAEYGFFSDVDSLPAVVGSWLAADEDRTRGARAAQVRARDISLNDFWSRTAAGLVQRGLPALPDA